MSPLHCQNITCRRPAWNGRTPRAIEDFTERFDTGTVTAFSDSSDGSTSLLLGILGMIEPPDSGEISVLGQSVLEMNGNDARRLRDSAFGYLFTHPHLLPSFTVAENIAMPYLRLCKTSIEGARERVAEVLATARLDAACANLAIANLDEECRWRVAFARAIVHNPKILIAVSPTAPFLLPLARSHARATGTVVLWNAGGEIVTGQCDRIIAPAARRVAIEAP